MMTDLWEVCVVALISCNVLFSQWTKKALFYQLQWMVQTLKALFGYSQYTWIGWDWKKFLRSLTCLGFKLIQSHSIHMDWELTEQALKILWLMNLLQYSDLGKDYIERFMAPLGPQKWKRFSCHPLHELCPLHLITCLHKGLLCLP
jgi:hypothetical protein